MRSHAYAIYAFCRLLDGVGEKSPLESARVAKLVAFDEMLDRVYGGDLPGEPTEQDRAVRAFAATVAACNIPRPLFDDFAEGRRMDLTITRYADWPALERYCYHAAGVVGVITCHVFGNCNAAAQSAAIAMGNAMQLTSILRDVADDFSRGRTFLPADERDCFGVVDSALAAGRVNEPWHAFMAFQIARARSLYADGEAGLHLIKDASARRVAAVIGRLHAGILDAIEQQNDDVFSRRTRLTMLQKLHRVPSALRAASSPSPFGKIR